MPGLATEDQIDTISKVLNDSTRPLKERFRALFTLRNLGGPKAVQGISNCFSDSSALLKHELAYCLGQMQDPSAIPILTAVLKDVKQEPMVRHEAGELVIREFQRWIGTQCCVGCHDTAKNMYRGHIISGILVKGNGDWGAFLISITIQTVVLTMSSHRLRLLVVSSTYTPKLWK